jgi:hypothetical protein
MFFDLLSTVLFLLVANLIPILFRISVADPDPGLVRMFFDLLSTVLFLLVANLIPTYSFSNQ